jgi:hypothetical protein
LRGGEGHARTKRLEIEPAGLDLTVETAPEICYKCQCVQDKWDVEGVRSIAQGGDEAIPPKTRNGAAGARLSVRRCKLHLELVVEDIGVLGIRWIGYWGCSFDCARRG